MKFTEYKSEMPGQRPYGGNYDAGGDLDGNGWWNILSHDKLGFADIKTGKSIEIDVAPDRGMEDIATARDREFYRTLEGAMTLQNNMALPWAQGPRRLAADPKNPIMWGASAGGVRTFSRSTSGHAGLPIIRCLSPAPVLTMWMWTTMVSCTPR